MRLCVLSELADDWKARVQRWAQLNHRRKRRPKADTAWPGPRIEYLLYQMLVGTWPAGEFDRAAHRERIHAYALKATREAKTHTSWVNPNADYETALRAFVDALLPEAGGGPFLADFEPFAREVAWFGALASLSQQLLKLTAPGVPDIYQGTELIDLSMVDPDNRRPVDYTERRRLLDDFEALDALAASVAPARDDGVALARAARALLDDPHDGRAKLWLTARTLRLRAARPALFRDGDYVPLEVSGERAEHVTAYLRRHGERAVLVVATRWHATLTERATRLPLGATVWGDTCIALPDEARGAWRDALSGCRVPGGRSTLPLAEVLATWPLVLLADED
jgi:(1->4)-alpha-D-glucan 1-alpha-D-glucosylmutase